MWTFKTSNAPLLRLWGTIKTAMLNMQVSKPNFCSGGARTVFAHVHTPVKRLSTSWRLTAGQLKAWFRTWSEWLMWLFHLTITSHKPSRILPACATLWCFGLIFLLFISYLLPLLSICVAKITAWVVFTLWFKKKSNSAIRPLTVVNIFARF